MRNGDDVEATRRGIDQINSALGCPQSQLPALAQRPGLAIILWVFLHPVGGGNAHEYRLFFRPHRSDCINDFEHDAGAVFQRSAIGIGALVGDRRKEVMQKVTVCRVNFHDIKTSLVGANGGASELLHNLFDFFYCQLARSRQTWKCQRAGADSLPPISFRLNVSATIPRSIGGCLAASMG